MIWFADGAVVYIKGVLNRAMRVRHAFDERAARSGANLIQRVNQFDLDSVL